MAPTRTFVELFALFWTLCGGCSASGSVVGIAGSLAQRMTRSNPSLVHFQVLGTSKKISKKILTRRSVRWSRWTSTQLRLGYAARSPLGLRVEGSEGTKLRFLHSRSERRRVSCNPSLERLSPIFGRSHKYIYLSKCFALLFAHSSAFMSLIMIRDR